MRKALILLNQRSIKEITMPIRTFGTMAVDWEERVHFDRLREERLARIKAELQKSDIGALLCFDMSNIRYITNTTIGTWAIDKLGRFCLLPQNDEPINWDFGIAAKHHQMYCSWFKEAIPARASRLYAAPCRRVPIVPKMWHARSASSLRSADCTRNRSAWTWSSHRSSL